MKDLSFHRVMSQEEVRRVILEGFQINDFQFLKGYQVNTLKVHDAQALDGNGAIQLAGFGSLYIQEQLSVPAPNVIAVEDRPSIVVESTSTNTVENCPSTDAKPVENLSGTNAIMVEDHPGTSPGTGGTLVEKCPSDSDSSRSPLMAKLTELITRLRVSFLILKYIYSFPLCHLSPFVNSKCSSLST